MFSNNRRAFANELVKSKYYEALETSLSPQTCKYGLRRI
jgi:hypothetical protein